MRRTKRAILEPNGKDTMGRVVMGGVFRFYDEKGLPLEILLQAFEDRELVVDWKSFCDDALEAGWEWKTILSRIEEPIKDVYGKHTFDEILKRIKLVYFCD